MKIINFRHFIKEQNETVSDEMKSEVRDMIEKSLKTSDNKTINEFIDAYIRDPSKTQINGLINDSDIYDFYLKYRNDVDENLSNSEFFNKLQDFQKENNCISLYDFVIKGTLESIKNTLLSLKETESEDTSTQ